MHHHFMVSLQSTPIQVDRSLSSLQSEVENFILRMAAEFPDRKEQLVFLINNYDMMLAVLTVREIRDEIEILVEYILCCF